MLAAIGVALVAVLGIGLGARALLGPKKPKTVKQSPVVRIAEPVRFARVKGTGITLALPANPPELIAIGFHQAENPRSRDLVPLLDWLPTDDNTQAVALVRDGWGKKVVMFQLNSRGRGTGLDTAADVAVRDGTLVVSPVAGTVTLVKHYKLYGRYEDVHIEIEPTGHPELRVAAIHLDDIAVEEGDVLVAGRTVIGRPRRFSFAAQIDRYIGRKVEHTHFQVNPYPPVKY